MQKRCTDKRSQKSEVKIFLFWLLASGFWLLAGCAERSPYKYYNIYSLIEPEVIKNGIKQPANYNKEFEDDKISIKFTIKEKKILFSLKNKTDKQLSVLWDRIYFIDIKGESHKVSGFENLFTEKQDKQNPLIIPAKERINNLIVPVENIEFMEEWTWYIRPIFNRTDDLAIENKGKTFSILMPIEIEGDIINYSYKFRIDHVIPHVTWIH